MWNSAEEFQQSGEAQRLTTLWEKAAVPEAPPPDQIGAQALAFGVNFRINLREAFKAAWETAQVAVKFTAAIHVPFDPVIWLEVGAEFLSAAQTIFSSLVQRMLPIDYVACVVLANSQGMKEIDFQREVVGFLNGANLSDFSWYLGMNDDIVRRAKEVLGNANWFTQVLTRLQQSDFVEDQQGTLKFKSHNFTIGWKDEGA